MTIFKKNFGKLVLKLYQVYSVAVLNNICYFNKQAILPWYLIKKTLTIPSQCFWKKNPTSVILTDDTKQNVSHFLASSVIVTRFIILKERKILQSYIIPVLIPSENIE